MGFKVLKAVLVLFLGNVLADHDATHQGKESQKQTIYHVNKEIKFEYTSQLNQDVAYLIGEVTIDTSN